MNENKTKDLKKRKKRCCLLFDAVMCTSFIRWSIRRATIPNVFCKILAGKIKAPLIAENEHCIVLRDLHSVRCVCVCASARACTSITSR